MRVIRLAASGAPAALVEAQAPQPRPGRGELLVRVSAAGVIRTELTWSPTSHREDGSARTGAVPAHEFSGVIAAVGEEAGPLPAGAEIFGMNDWYSEGALAEYCLAPFTSVAPKPRRLSHVEAASVPISALTAWQGLLDRARLRPGERVLVQGGAGGVGMFAVQLARLHGAHAIATASARDHEFVASLGAEQVIDYRESRWEDRLAEVDVVFDTVGGETLARSLSVLKPAGRVVTIVSPETGSEDARLQQAFFIVEPKREQLEKLAALLDAGELRTAVAAVIPLAEAALAYAGRLPGQGRGKVVVEVAKGE